MLHHAAVTYSHIPLWYYYEAPHDGSATALDVFLALNQAYFMGFFFLIAGYFTPGALDRKGVGRFVRDRLVRLGIPLLLFVIVVRAVVGIPGWSVSGLPYAEYYVLSWDPGPTWFLEVLLVFSLVYAVVRRLRPDAGARSRRTRCGAGGSWRSSWGWPSRRPCGGWWCPTAPTCRCWACRRRATCRSTPRCSSVGVLAYRRDWLSGLTRRAARWAWVAAVVAVPSRPAGVRAAPAGGRIATAVFEAVFATAHDHRAAGAVPRPVGGHGRWAPFLSANAFAVYVLHAVVITALGIALSGLVAPAIVKALVLGVLGLPLCWAFAAAVRALPGAKKVL